MRITLLLLFLSFINAQIALPTFQAVHKPHTAEASSLYDFTSQTFTNCANTGYEGPTLSECTSDANYSASWTDNTEYFDVSLGVQKWTVPKSATYQITVYGAQGGAATYSGGQSQPKDGGEGAVVRGNFSLNQSDILWILVGQMGAVPTTGNQNPVCSGGGGGTFVAKGSDRTSATALIVAGGGGGSYKYRDWGQGDDGVNEGSTLQSGATTVAGLQGANGTNSGSGGAAFDKDGDYSTAYAHGPARSFTHATLPGVGSRTKRASYGGDGGFGGGGEGYHASMSNDRVPGGGGYSGGNAAQTDEGGNGGISFNSGSSQNNSGTNTRHGKVICTIIE
jgi:hypothetical protein